MGNLFQRLWKKQEVRIVIQGLDFAGKTTILYKLKLGEVVTTIPTIGFNVETLDYKKISFTCWDLGSRDKMRPIFRHYYQNTDAIIYVIDSGDKERFSQAKEELENVLNQDELRESVVLIMANKQDLPHAATVTEVTEALQLHSIKQQWRIFPTCAGTGENLYESLDWLSEAINNKSTNPTPITHAVVQANTNTEKFLAKNWEYIKNLFTY